MERSGKLHLPGGSGEMTESELATLLNRSESEILDFKSKQYLFAGASNEDKGELLKDILAMSNAWKTSDAYILIGVEEENERAIGICGAATTLGDNDVQQFVNSKTNRPISFRLEVFLHKGANLTIIHIDKNQRRPIHLIKSFGGLEKEVVYIRRGTSTDKAAPEEIAEMGKEDARTNAKPDVGLEFEFVIESYRSDIGAMIGGVWADANPKYEDRDRLKIYAVNRKGGLAQYVQGSVWIPSSILMDYMTIVATSPEGHAEAKLLQFEVSNKISERTVYWAASRPPEWKPLSPGMRIFLREFKLAPYRQSLAQAPCSMRWQLAIDGWESTKGETKFADIPLIDQRHK
jgi:hypothetical protein